MLNRSDRPRRASCGSDSAAPAGRGAGRRIAGGNWRLAGMTTAFPVNRPLGVSQCVFTAARDASVRTDREGWCSTKNGGELVGANIPVDDRCVIGRRR